MCNCDNYKSYDDYKKEKEDLIGFFHNKIKDDDCIHCYNFYIYKNPNPSSDLIKKRIKKIYNIECNCEHYYSYNEMIKNKKEQSVVAQLMPKDNCYNCYLIKRYGASNKDFIKNKKIEEAKERILFRKKN